MFAAIDTWQSTRWKRLSELLDAHKQMGGSSRGRRYRTEQINRALVLICVAEFQGFCRDLHDEACTEFATSVSRGDEDLLEVVFRALTAKRQLDKGNPSQSTLQEDFSRLGLDLRTTLQQSHVHNRSRWRKLAEVLELRNAVAHSDPRKLPSTATGAYDIRLDQVKSWMWAMNMLTHQMTIVVSKHVQNLVSRDRQ